MRFLKYEFPKNIADSIMESIGDPKVNLGELKKGFIACDVLWYGEPIEELNQYLVFPMVIGNHTFAGCEQLYAQELQDYLLNKLY